MRVVNQCGLAAVFTVLATLTVTPQGVAPRTSPGTRGSARASTPPATTDREIRSAYHALTLTTHTRLLPPPARQRAGGALAAWGDGAIVVTATGDFYRLSWAADKKTLQAARLPLSLPFNRAALTKQSGTDAANPFRVTDLLVEGTGDRTRIYVAHHYWHSDGNCVSLRVSSTVLPGADDTAPPPAGWDTLFDSRPCLAVGKLWPLGEEADRSGGKLARHGSGLLVTVGDHGLDGLKSTPSWPQDPGTSYGKILLVDAAKNVSQFSIGHRNQQGLTVDAQGRAWSTEHGPEGGDEVNLVVQGGNYGWPLVTYGTDYDKDAWPFAVNDHDHGKFREPAMAFVPSVGLSELIQVRSNYFPRWRGDLLVASLRAGTLFRMRTSGDRIVYAEPINVFTRIRDLSEGRDGRLWLWNDDGQVALLTRVAPRPAS